MLDGPTGTELSRRGVSTDLPLWSAGALLSAPEVVREIHEDYVAAGAEIVTANTFRTHARTLRAAGLEDHAADLTRSAVELARAAGPHGWVVGSQAPLEDCYRPDLVPSDSELEREHAEMAANLAAAGVDGILVETHNTICEAAWAVRAAAATGLPTLVSFVCGRDARLLSGESLHAAVQAVLPHKPVAVLVNCLPSEAVTAALSLLRRAAGEVPIGAYANVGYADEKQGWVNTDSVNPAGYAEQGALWLKRGARLMGGCCGTTPAHIRKLRLLIDTSETG